MTLNFMIILKKIDVTSICLTAVIFTSYIIIYLGCNSLSVRGRERKSPSFLYCCNTIIGSFNVSF